MANMTKLALFRQCAILFRTIPCEEVNAILIYLQMLETDADKSKFERIYVQYRGLMLRVANSILHNEQDAEDTIHQAFLAILNNLDKISAVDCPETQSYIVIITEHKAIDLIRDRKKVVNIGDDETELGLEVPMPGDSPLADALAKLPPRYREVLLLRFDNGYSTREIAAMLGMEHGAVQKLIWRAKDALEKHMEEDAV